MRNENRVVAAICASLLLGITGCASGQKEQKDDFFTSGDREADQRGSGSVPKKTGKEESSKRDAKNGGQIQEKTTLYERLGGEERIRLIVDDFIKRALEDPRVNWTRKGVAGGILGRNRPEEWSPTPENVQQLKEHFVQFISLASGGPSKYDGKPIKTTHAEMRISKSEFDATIGDLKATLDHLKVPNDVQKELLAIFESTRAQIVPDK